MDRKQKLWQHEDTGRITSSIEKPSERWYFIPSMYEDDLPGMTDDEYSMWFDNSYVDGVRMGPLVCTK